MSDLWPIASEAGPPRERVEARTLLCAGRLDRDQRLCRNFLCILRGLDLHELVGAEVLRAEDIAGWVRFRDDPYRAYLGLDDGREEKCFALVQTRLPADLRASEPSPYALLCQADAALHERQDEHGRWAHALVHRAAAHLSPEADIRAQVESHEEERLL